MLKRWVLTLLKKPEATFRDRAFTAAQWDVPVSATAVEKRFTPPLVDFLREVLGKAWKELAVAEPTSVALLPRFTAVFIGDSSSSALPDEWQALFPGCGGTKGSGQAALQLQVRWNRKTDVSDKSSRHTPCAVRDSEICREIRPTAHGMCLLL